MTDSGNPWTKLEAAYKKMQHKVKEYKKIVKIDEKVRIEHLREKERLEQELEQLKSEKGEREEELALVKLLCGEKIDEIKRLEQEIAEYKQAIDGWYKKYQSLDEEYTRNVLRLKKELALTKNLYKTKQYMWRKEIKLRREVKSELIVASIKIQQLEQENSDLKTKINKITTIHGMFEEWSKMEQDLKVEKYDNFKLKNDLAECKNEFRIERDLRRSAQNEVIRLTEELADKKKENSTLRIMCDKLHVEINRLEQKTERGNKLEF